MSSNCSRSRYRRNNGKAALLAKSTFRPINQSELEHVRELEAESKRYVKLV